MTAEPDLLPCPFCGGRPKTKSTFVRCAECGGQMCFGETEELDSVIAAWNARANLAELQREVEGLRAEVQFLRSHRPIARKLAQAEARAERLAEALRPLVMAVEALKFDIFRLATPELQEAFDGRNVVSVVQQSTTQPLRNALLAARAALEQENDDA